MTIRKQGTCKECGGTRYGDDGLCYLLDDDGSAPKEPKPITGWVAWHPEFTPEKWQIKDLLSFSEGEAWCNLIRLYESYLIQGSLPKCVETEWDDINGGADPEDILGASSWKIRPVELRFTDEGEG